MIFMQPKLSTEIFTIPFAEDRFIIYAPLKQIAFITNIKLVNFLATIKENNHPLDSTDTESILDFLKTLRLINGEEEILPVTEFFGTPKPVGVTLFLTTACNLRCTYCYASAGDTPIKSMNLEVAKRGIDFVSNNAKDLGSSEFSVDFHGGGEPTVNWKTMTLAHEYAKLQAAKLGLELTSSTASNGVLSNTQIDWIIENLNGVSLSFDGDSTAQDTHRPMASGKASSHRVIHTLKRFDEKNFHYGIRITVTEDQIVRLPKSIEFICRQFNPQNIMIEPAYQMGRWHNAPSAETEAFIQAYRQAKQIARSFSKEVIYSAARVDLLTNHFCGVSQDSFSLSPDGNVSSCYEVFSEDNTWAEHFFYGKPDEQAGYTFDHKKLNKLRNHAVQHKPYCQGCFAKWHCAGDCHHKAMTINGDGEFNGSDRCHVTQALTLDQILERIQESGGVIWHDSDNTITQMKINKVPSTA